MKKETELFNGLPLPKTNIQEILATLIIQGYVSCLDFPYLSGYRTRVSEIVQKHGLAIKRKICKKTNKFGNPYTYALYFLPEEEKENAKKLYLKLYS